MTRVGLFVLGDGATDERAARVAATVDAIDYPWRRLLPALRDDPDRAVVIRWDDTGQGVTGLYYGNRVEIVLSEASGSYTTGSEPFVLSHEIGHLVDDLTFDDDTRQAILDLWHRDLDGPHDGKVDPNDRSDDPAPFAWSHENPHREVWRNRDDEYLLRPNEAYADAFVEAFAPTIWSGDYPDGAQRFPRFAHRSENLAEIRRLTLTRSIPVFDDVPDDHLFADDIADLSALGIVQGYPDGTFRPDEPVTRQAVAAFLARTLDHVAPGWRPTV